MCSFKIFIGEFFLFFIDHQIIYILMTMNILVSNSFFYVTASEINTHHVFFVISEICMLSTEMRLIHMKSTCSLQ